MLRNFAKILSIRQSKRFIATSCPTYYRVVILGAAGGVGQALALLMKTNPLVTDLVLHDQQNVASIAVDISHMDTFCSVTAFTGKSKMPAALECAELVVCAAAKTNYGGKLTCEQEFKANAEIIKEVAECFAKSCPKAFLAIITSPVNSMVPLAAEVLKQRNCYDPKKLFGISALDTSRARCLIGDYLNIDPQKVSCEVIGGSSDHTAVPIISRAEPFVKGDQKELSLPYKRVRGEDAGAVPIKGIHGAGYHLSAAEASFRFCHSLLRALHNEMGVEVTAFVESPIYQGVTYFSSRITLSHGGVKKILKLPEMNAYEKALLEESVKELKKNIAVGVEYANRRKKESIKKAVQQN